MDEEFELNDFVIQVVLVVYELEVWLIGLIVSFGDINNVVMVDFVIDFSVSFKSIFIRRVYKIWEWLSCFLLLVVGVVIIFVFGLIVVFFVFVVFKFV